MAEKRLLAEKLHEDDLADELLGDQAKEKSDYQLEEEATHKSNPDGMGAGKPLGEAGFREPSEAKKQLEQELTHAASVEMSFTHKRSLLSRLIGWP